MLDSYTDGADELIAGPADLRILLDDRMEVVKKGPLLLRAQSSPPTKCSGQVYYGLIRTHHILNLATRRWKRAQGRLVERFDLRIDSQ